MPTRVTGASSYSNPNSHSKHAHAPTAYSDGYKGHQLLRVHLREPGYKASTL